MRQKHGLLLFLSTCIPGCGQMHQGYMKRGTSLLTAFSAIFALALLLELGALAAFLPVVWLYAFFDSYNLRARIADGTETEDAFLFGLSDMDATRLTELCRKRHSLIGWCLVAGGVYLFYRTAVGWIMSMLGRFFNDTWWLHEILLYDLPRLVMTLLVIALGLWFIRGPRSATTAEDIPAFTPPTPEGEPGRREEAPHETNSAD